MDVIGVGSVGAYSGLLQGVRVRGGPRLGDVALLGELDLAWLGASRSGDADPTHELHGRDQRAGAAVEWTVAHARGEDTPELGLYLLAGAGVHEMTWDRGGALVRADVELGLGLQQVFRWGRDTPHPWTLGWDMGAIVILGARPMDAAARCAGPCDRPTAPLLADRYYYVQLISFDVWR